MRGIYMVFSSLFFIFAFFCPSMLIYTLVDKKYKNIVLLVSSLIFYGWSSPSFLILLLLDTCISWFLALRIERNPDHKKLYLIIDCVATLSILAFFKYTMFLCSNFQLLFGVPKAIPTIVLPIGISFYTFQLLSYVVDVYRNQVQAQPKYTKLLLYSSLFHQCIAGPIVRYESIADQIDDRQVKWSDIYAGIRRFCIGLAKKAILANGCAQACDSLITMNDLSKVSASALWLGMVFFMLQIYLDFSAYSDMAIGMGRMIGFHYLENFDYPYQAKSVQDFWRRWHISLSSFFRDYVYIPLGGNRCDTKHWIRNMAVVWLLTGLWHGASWNFILWGAYYLAFLLMEHFYPKKIQSHIYALLIIYFGWIIFKFEDIHQLGQVFLGLVGIGRPSFFALQTKTIFLKYIFFFVFAIIACTKFGKMSRIVLHNAGKRNKAIYYFYLGSEYCIPVLLFIVSVIALVGNTYNPFLYFQF